MRVAYFDCFSGISGDMVLGALVDLGVPVDRLAEDLKRMPLAGFSLRAEAVSRGAIAATQVHVDVEDAGAARTWADIRRLVGEANLPEAIRARSLSVFRRLAEVEARIHRRPIDEVHFHEVGGTDAIVDVVGAAVGLDYLRIDRIVSSPLPLGRGFADCRHGRIPVPAPATVALLSGIPVYGEEVELELVTPTGAALISVLADAFGPLPSMRIETVGCGAGSAERADRPNLLRIMTGSDAIAKVPPGTSESVGVLEAAVDDMNPEHFGFLMERLFAEGALDVCWMPVYMKKNRPGTRVEVICRPEEIDSMTAVLLSESTSTGVRHRVADRRVLPRRQVTVETDFGPVRATEVEMPDGIRRRTPEYEDCRKIALSRGVPVWRIYEAVSRAGYRSGGAEGGPSGPDSV